MRLVVCLFLVASLAGCAESADPVGAAAPEPDDPPLVRPPTQLVMDDCTILEAFAAVPAGPAQEHVPPGFTLDVLPSGDTLVVFGAASCEQGDRGFLALRVVPDAALAGRDGDNLFWEPEHIIVAGSAVADAFTFQQATATLGNITVSETGPGGELDIEVPSGTHRVVPVAGPVVPTSIEMSLLTPFREYVPAKDGFAYLEAAYGGAVIASSSVAPVIIETAPDTPSRDILGASRGAFALTVTTSSFDGATIGFVPYG